MSLAHWHVYLLECDGRAIYTGISTDVGRRVSEHAAGRSRGARYTRGRGELRLLYSVEIGPRGLAARVESRIKRLPREEKLALAGAGLSRESLLLKLRIGE